MESIKRSFISLALEHNALNFGNFTLKSERVSPYFFNAGAFYQGKALRLIGQCYADILIKNNIEFDHLFGPAYKGLPLATSTAIALAQKNINTTVTFDRKEIKNHGEGGILIGAPLNGQTIIIDDVITAGTAFKHALKLIETNGGTVTAVIIALDRCEKGNGEDSAITEIQEKGIKVFSIINIFDIIEYLENNKIYSKELKNMKKYLQQ